MLSVKTREHIRRRLEIAGPHGAVLLCAAASLGVCLAVVGDSMHIVEISDTHGQSGVVVTCATDVNTIVDQAGLTAPGSEAKKDSLTGGVLENSAAEFINTGSFPVWFRVWRLGARLVLCRRPLRPAAAPHTAR